MGILKFKRGSQFQPTLLVLSSRHPTLLLAPLSYILFSSGNISSCYHPQPWELRLESLIIPRLASFTATLKIYLNAVPRPFITPSLFPYQTLLILTADNVLSSQYSFFAAPTFPDALFEIAQRWNGSCSRWWW